MRGSRSTIAALLPAALSATTGVELLVHASSPWVASIPVAVLLTYLILWKAAAHPLATSTAFVGLFTAEALLLDAAEQLSALVVWALLAHQAGGERTRRAAVGLGINLLPLVAFKAAQPDRDWLDFAPATALLVVAAWSWGWAGRRRTSTQGEVAAGVVTSATPRAQGDRPPITTGLSVREQQVLDLLVTGMTNPEIAETLHVSRATVKTHVSHILAKLGVEDRVQAAVLATRTRGPGGVA